MGTSEFMGARMMAMVVLGGVTFGLVLLMQGEPMALLLFPMIMALVGYLLPVFWLRGRVKKRQKVILKTLPDAIDLMTISVEAGLAFDGAMQRVADKWDNDLGTGVQESAGGNAGWQDQARGAA